MQTFAIVPAAGHSRRMGQPKLLLPWGDWTIGEQVLWNWRCSRVTRVLVVVRRDDDALAAGCRRVAAREGTTTAGRPLAPLDLVRPDLDPPDMKASARAALDFLERTYVVASTDAWLLAPADLPQLSVELIDALVAAAEPAATQIVVPVCGGRRGHPVLFPLAAAEEVRRLADGEGLDRLVARLPSRSLEFGPAALAADVDTPDDYRRLVEGTRRRC